MQFDIYEFCRNNPTAGQKTPIKDSETGVMITVPGLPARDEMTPAGLAAYAKATSATVSLPKTQIDATHTTKQKGGKYVGELAGKVMGGWLGLQPVEAPKEEVAPVNNGQTNRIPPATVKK